MLATPASSRSSHLLPSSFSTIPGFQEARFAYRHSRLILWTLAPACRMWLVVQQYGDDSQSDANSNTVVRQSGTLADSDSDAKPKSFAESKSQSVTEPNSDSYSIA